MQIIGLFISRSFIVIASMAGLVSCSAMTPLGCTDNWKITGYYTPVETDFSGQEQQIQLVDARDYTFKADFISAVKIEGWGKTTGGWYLGYYSNNWHKSHFPKDANGHALKIGKVAADPAYLASGVTIHIDNMLDTLGRGQFKVADVGSSVKGRHIDVYTGEGEQARKASWAVTGSHRVCSI